MNSNAYEHPNFVWLEFEAVHEILDNRIPGSSDAIVVFNNLLRWTLYQMDRTALDVVEVKTEFIVLFTFKTMNDTLNGLKTKFLPTRKP